MSSQPSSSSFRTRALSALVAILILSALYYFFKQSGLIAIVFIGGIKAQMEYTRMTLEGPGLKFDRVLLNFVSLALLTVITFFDLRFFGAAGVFGVFLLIGILMFHRHNQDLLLVRDLMALTALGFFYTGIIPTMMIALLKLPQGDFWFFTLLGIVFFGDTFAYFAGRAFGKTKMFPHLSPKKTWAGAFGGGFGSLLAATISHFFLLTSVPLWILLGMAVIASPAAQIGDFFESLLKRVANKKDSGTIMPGHGGLLDRIDGLLFASPIVFWVAQEVSRLS